MAAGTGSIADGWFAVADIIGEPCLTPKRRSGTIGGTLLDDPRVPPQAPPGLRDQLKATVDTARRLVSAHVDLAKAEASSIAGEVARVAALAGIAVAVLLFAGLLVTIGTSLFLGEWLLGSMGWGILHGLLFAIAVAIACVTAAIGIPGRLIGQAFLVGVIVAVVIGALLAFAGPNRLYTNIGDSVAAGIEPGVRPLLVGIVVGALVGLVVGGVFATRADGSGLRAGAMTTGVLVGALVGALSAISFGGQPGVGVGIAVGYLTWIGVMAALAYRHGVDTEQLMDRFYPSQTIETSKETLEWLQTRMPPGIG